jgi:hypothetical protein
MTHISAVIAGFVIAVLLLLMAGIAHVTDWPTSFAMTAKIALGLAIVVGGLALIGLVIYTLGLAGMGLLGAFFLFFIVLFEKTKAGVAAIFRRG